MRWARGRCCTHPRARGRRERQRAKARTSTRATLERLSEPQIALALDALEGHEVAWSDTDHAALLEFARIARAELGNPPAVTEIEALARERPRLASLGAGEDDEHT